MNRLNNFYLSLMLCAGLVDHQIVHGFPFQFPEAEFKLLEGAKIATIDAVPELGIRYRVYQTIDDFESVSIHFDALSKEQFDFLKSRFGGEENDVPYDAQRRYQLTDFLPAKLQAVDGHTFYTEEMARGNLSCNCWGTAYEMVRGGRDFFVFYVDGQVVKRVMTDPRYFDQVAAILPNETPRVSTDQVKFGDTFLFTSHGVLMHAATLIDPHLLFEMRGISSHNPFRLIYLETPLSHPHRKGEKVDIVRSKVGRPLPAPPDVFEEVVSARYELSTIDDPSHPHFGRSTLKDYAYLEPRGPSEVPAIVQQRSAIFGSNCGLTHSVK